VPAFKSINPYLNLSGGDLCFFSIFEKNHFMYSKSPNIHPVFDRMLQRKDKEKLLGQRSLVIWMTGLSGSGKSTIAIGLEQELYRKGFITQILDGDNIRSGININLGFSNDDRRENIRRIAEVSKLFLNCGIITINCFVSPTEEIRKSARTIIGDDDFIEIFIDAPVEICEKRDVKGLYKKARNGEIIDFTGVDAPFEKPVNPHLTLDTDKLSVDESVNKIIDFIMPLIAIK
jgi:adenylylsulfate kinase